MKAAVLGPEEEPDGCEDESYADEGEESKEAFVVDVVGVKGPPAGLVVWIDGLSLGRERESACREENVLICRYRGGGGSDACKELRERRHRERRV